jgi:hypothetical protein
MTQLAIHAKQVSQPRRSNPITGNEPKRYGALRHPLRFLRARWRLMMGRPLSVRWGLDRGFPAHRYYVQGFLQRHADDIRGTCMEFDDRDYMDRFGGEAVSTFDVLHINSSNPRATVVADITKPNDIPSDTYDCIICTHVLHIIPDFAAAIEGLHRILRPGGVLLAAVPMTSQADESEENSGASPVLGCERPSKHRSARGMSNLKHSAILWLRRAKCAAWWLTNSPGVNCTRMIPGQRSKSVLEP